MFFIYKYNPRILNNFDVTFIEFKARKHTYLVKSTKIHKIFSRSRVKTGQVRLYQQI